jgi:hypothetical protein
MPWLFLGLVHNFEGRQLILLLWLGEEKAGDAMHEIDGGSQRGERSEAEGVASQAEGDDWKGHAPRNPKGQKEKKEPLHTCACHHKGVRLFLNVSLVWSSEILISIAPPVSRFRCIIGFSSYLLAR